MKKLLSITVRGRSKEWSFNFYGDPKYLNDWREDGLEVDEVVNIIPHWAPPRIWCFLQDLWNFRWLK